MHWLSWLFRRAAIFPFVWALTHATIFAWQALDPNYLKWAQWVADSILTPLHPMVVWLTKQMVPALETFIQNTKPTHHDAPKVLYPFFMGVFGLAGALFWIAGRMVINFIRGHFQVKDVQEPVPPVSEPKREEVRVQGENLGQSRPLKGKTLAEALEEVRPRGQ